MEVGAHGFALDIIEFEFTNFKELNIKIYYLPRAYNIKFVVIFITYLNHNNWWWYLSTTWEIEV